MAKCFWPHISSASVGMAWALVEETLKDWGGHPFKLHVPFNSCSKLLHLKNQNQHSIEFISIALWSTLKLQSDTTVPSIKIKRNQEPSFSEVPHRTS